MELIVVLAVIGIAAGLATVAFDALASRTDGFEATREGRLRDAQRTAVLGGTPVVFRWKDEPSALLLPDGRVVGRGYDFLVGTREARP